jgi:hypothetical protein
VSTCRGCGKPIVWGETIEGPKIPLDPRAPVYILSPRRPDGTVVIKRTANALVSHFVTCSAADQFSGRNKGKAPAVTGASPNSEAQRD